VVAQPECPPAPETAGPRSDAGVPDPRVRDFKFDPAPSPIQTLVPTSKFEFGCEIPGHRPMPFRTTQAF
jgi:hypothetical protein